MRSHFKDFPYSPLDITKNDGTLTITFEGRTGTAHYHDKYKPLKLRHGVVYSAIYSQFPEWILDMISDDGYHVDDAMYEELNDMLDFAMNT